jgi:nicotinate-nucleotide adenylyltransferase
MVQLAINDYPKLRASDVEFKMTQPNYTVHTLAHLTDKFPKHTFSLIMGEDNLLSIHKWKNYQQILANHKIYVYPRITGLKSEDLTIDTTNIHQVDSAIMEISATDIRQGIKVGKNVRPMLPETVWQYIDHNLFYRK